jgi:mono/diheme cytochrome c family protein
MMTTGISFRRRRPSRRNRYGVRPQIFLTVIFFAAVLLFMVGGAGEHLSAQKAASSGGSFPDTTSRNGKEIYLKSCAVCHGEQGQGTAGPNLTDRFWIHGGGIKNISATVLEGVPGKGMIGWKALLSAAEVQKVSGYVLSLQDTKPPKGKKPEGQYYK